MALRSYIKTTYQNTPSTSTPINQTNLNHAEDELQALDDWVDAPETDTIAEHTSGAGVTVDGVLLKDKIANVDGLKFPASAVASADANTLDDYEENTFTPGISFGGASVGVTYTTRAGLYTKIGRVVFFELQILLSSKGSSAGSARIINLPFTSNSTSTAFGGVIIGSISQVTFADMLTAYVNYGTTNIELRETTNAGVVSALTNTDFANDSNLILSGFYFV